MYIYTKACTHTQRRTDTHSLQTGRQAGRRVLIRLYCTNSEKAPNVGSLKNYRKIENPITRIRKKLADFGEKVLEGGLRGLKHWLLWVVVLVCWLLLVAASRKCLRR